MIKAHPLLTLPRVSAGKVALTHIFLQKCLIWESHLNANPACQQRCWDSRCDWWVCFTQFCLKAASTLLLLSFYTVARVPRDLLVNYTWALLFNMGWKHTWVPSIKHFLCCTFFLWYTVTSGAEVCVCVCDIRKKRGRNYSLALYFALSASLLILMFNNSGANAELQISSRKNRINWPSAQASCQSLGWRVNASP